MVRVLYPFGYGLTYTTFDYSDLAASPLSAANTSDADISVSLTVQNTGNVASDDVVQLYTKYKDAASSKVYHPLKTLSGFERIHLDAGQSQVVRFNLKLSDLAIWDVSRQHVLCRARYLYFHGEAFGGCRYVGVHRYNRQRGSDPARNLGEITPDCTFTIIPSPI